MAYIDKDSIINAITQLPVTEFNGVKLYPAERVKKVIDFFPTHKGVLTTQLITDYEHDKNMDYAQCMACKKFAPTIPRLMDEIEFCPYCGSKIVGIHPGTWVLE